jgi:hypothetical protein
MFESEKGGTFNPHNFSIQVKEVSYFLAWVLSIV